MSDYERSRRSKAQDGDQEMRYTAVDAERLIAIFEKAQPRARSPAQ